ncbi:hypothetical protein Tco_0472964 [Tanacetum coccineum]
MVDETRIKSSKDQVNSQVKKKIDKILPRIVKLVNEQLEFEVLIRSSNEAKTSHDVAANLSKLELKKILIDKMKSNKSIDRSDEQKNLYKALVNAYEADKALLDAYGDSVTIKRCWDNVNDDQEPSVGPDRGSKRRRAGKEPESSTEVPMHTADDFEDPTHQEFDTRLNNDQLEEEAHPHLDWFQQPSRLPSLDQDWNKTVPTDHGPVQPWLSNLARKKYPRESFDELMDTPFDFSAFMMNRLKVDTLTPELLAGPTFEARKGNNARDASKDVYFQDEESCCHELQIIGMSMDNKHLDWITIRRDDDKLYSFKEGDFKILCLQDIEDMLILLVQGKLTNLKVEEHLAFSVALRMFTRSIVIQRRVEDLQLGVESYQKKLNITKSDIYRPDLRQWEAYTAYPNPQGFIYQNRDKKNRLMCLDELYKFSYDTLNE